MMHFSRFLLPVLLFFSVFPAAGQEYSVFGQIDMEARYSRNITETLLSAEADHSLDYEDFSFRLRHKLNVDGQENLEHELNEACLSWNILPELTINAGKQRLPWGRGTAFFPTDSLHPAHTRDDVEGFTGISATVNPDISVQLTGAVDFSVPIAADPGSSENTDFYKDLKYALNTSIIAGSADIALTAVYRNGETLRPGVGISCDIAGFILTSEAAVELDNGKEYPDTTAALFEKRNEPAALVSAGIRRVIIPGLLPDISFMLAGEYLYDGTGFSRNEEERYFELMSGWSGTSPETPAMGQLYLFFLTNMEYINRFSIELSCLVNGTDSSAFWTAEFTMLTVPGMDIYTGMEFLSGKSGTEYGVLKEEYGEYRINLGSRIYF